MNQEFQLFRLRINNDIQGYMKLFANGIINYSKDQFWWHGDMINYDQKDQFQDSLTEIIALYLKTMLWP